MKRHDREKLLERYRVTDGRKFRLKDHDPADRGGHLVDHDKIGHEKIGKLLADGVDRLSKLQQLLYADESWSVLLVLQAMDAAGKDGTIKHVMTGVNPQGVNVTSFKQPGPEDLSHGFLWRIHAHAPAHGRIAIFNRSHYEDVLVSRVHPEMLDRLHLPDAVRGHKFWKRRLEDITAFETYLANQGTVIVKIFLNLSKEEQKRRFLSRLDEPGKTWKFSAADLKERGFWADYQDAYEAAIAATASPSAPWYVVPADDKEFAHLIVAEALIDALDRLDLKSPSPSAGEAASLEEARRTLENE